MSNSNNETSIKITAVDAASETLGKVKGSIEGMIAPVGQLQGAMAGLAGAFGAFSIAEFLSNNIKAAGSLHDLSMRTGASVEALSSFKDVAKLSDTSLESVGTALQKLSKNMLEAQTGSKDQAALFKALGVSVVDTSGKLRSSDEVMEDVAKSIADLQSPTERVAAAQLAFGKSGAALVPMLMDLSEQGRGVAKTTAEQAALADRIGDNMTRLGLKSKAAATIIANETLPAIDAFVGALVEAQNESTGLVGKASEFAKDGSIKQWSISAAQALAYVADAGQGVARTITIIGKGIGASAAMAFAKTPEAAKAVFEAFKSDIDRELMGELFSDKLARQIEKIGTSAQSSGGRVGDFVARLEKLKNAKDKVDNGFDDIAREQAKLYAKLWEEGEKYVATLDAQDAAGRKLTKAEEALVEIEKKLPPHLQAVLKPLLERAKALEDIERIEKEAMKRRAEGIAQDEKEYDNLVKLVEEQKKKNAEIGLTTEALAAKHAADMQEEIDSKAKLLAFFDENEIRGEQVELLRKQIETMKELKTLRADGAAREAAAQQAKEVAQEYARLYEGIERGIGDALLAGGKDGLSNLGDTIKAWLKTMATQMILRPMIQPVFANMASMFGVNMSLAGGSWAGGGAGGLNALSAGSSLYSSFAGGSSAMLGGMIGGEFGAGMAGAYLAPGLAGPTTLGASGAMGMGASLGAALPWIGGALALGSILGFGKKNPPKPSQLGLMHAVNDRSGASVDDYYYLSQNDVPGGDGNLPLYLAYEAKLNDALKKGLVDKAKLDQIVGKYLVGSAGESAEAMLQKIDAMLDGLGAGTQDIAENSQLAAAKRELELRIMAMSGKELEVLKIRREEELKAADESLRPLMEQIYALEDQATAAEKATEAAKAAADAEKELQATRLDAVRTAESDLRAAFDAQAGQLDEAAKQFSDFAKSIASFRQSLRIGEYSTLDPFGKLNAAQSAYEATQRRAALGDAGAIGDLQGAAEAYLGAARDYYGSTAEYARIFDSVDAGLSQVQSVSERQAALASEQLAALRSQVGSLISIDSGVKSVEAAIRALSGARADYAASTIGSTQGRINSLGAAANDTDWYTYGVQMNERYGDSGIVAYLNQARAAGGSMSGLDRIFEFPAGTVEEWARQRGVASFDVGTPRVPRTGLALIHKDEQITPAGHANEMVVVLREVLTELRAGTVQRGAVGTASIERLEAVADRLEGVRREIKRAA